MLLKDFTFDQHAEPVTPFVSNIRITKLERNKIRDKNLSSSNLTPCSCYKQKINNSANVFTEDQDNASYTVRTLNEAYRKLGFEIDFEETEEDKEMCIRDSI